MKHNPAKVKLSPYELELVTNAQILLTKNEIIKKVYELFGALAEDYVEVAQLLLSQDETSISPKISRGENYHGLPYIVLDYPRNFSKEDTFAIRTFFWWGHFFSITLQLSGKYQEKYLPLLTRHFLKGEMKDWFIGVGEDPWEHHFEGDNYQEVSIDTRLCNKSFIKLATKIPLQEWDNVSDFLQTQFSLLLQILTSDTME